jgi:hypothetical protein
MASFKAGGVEWRVRLNYGVCADVKRETGLDLLAPVSNPETFADVLFADPAKLVGALYVVCQDQAEKAGVTPERFGREFDGDTLDAAVTAILEEVIGFFRKTQGRDAMRKNLPAMLAKQAAAANLAVETSLLTGSDSASNSPGSAGSTPGPTPSPSS